MPCKGFQNCKLTRRERHRFAIFAQFASAEVEFKIAEHHHFFFKGRSSGFVGARSTAKYGVDACKQFTWIERLGDVVIGTKFQSDDAVDILAAGCEHQHRRHVFAGAQATQNLQAVFAGQHQIKDERIKAFAHPNAIHRGSAVGHRNAKAVIAEIAAQEVAQTGVVVNNQYLRRAFLFSHVMSFPMSSCSRCGPFCR